MDAVKARGSVVDAGEGVDRRVSHLLDRYESAIYRFAFFILRDPDLASDCTQETFVRAYEHLLRGREVTPAWLYTVARSRAIDELRRRKREAPPEAETPGPVPGSATMLEVQEAFAHLSPDDRVILFLLAQGLSAAEISRVLGVRLNAARQRVFRARERFRKLLGDDGG